MTPDDPPAEEIDPEIFFRADIRLGTIIDAQPFPEARKPAYKLQVDFGPGVGVKKSSAQITDRYGLEDLPGRRVLAVVNFPPRQIGPARSEVLVLGVHDADGAVLLLGADGDAPDGARVS
ncbi:tRNA-binding protein [Marinicauda salina]|uniref:tRNA-binding protein n=1 Tax=Marinicauda salina TaxID=2135793 RepID=A0A2U2BSI2_9PROT|nr:tRNA-binding protein [Marinicauda salina]PWE16957.1 tRNA-binding protein [Marinicauda salina]